MADNNTVPTPKSNRFSSTLKEKLKRCGRYHSSPSAPPCKKYRPSIIPPTSSDSQSISRKEHELSESSYESNESTDVNHCVDFSEKTPRILSKTDFTPLKESDGIGDDGCVRSDPKMLKCELSNSASSPTLHTKVNNDTTPRGTLVTAQNKFTNNLQCQSKETSSAERNKLVLITRQKEEALRKLKLVKFYKTKHNLEDMEKVICKWRQVSQEALVHLQSSVPEPRPTLTELINHLQVDPQLIQYDPDTETFIL